MSNSPEDHIDMDARVQREVKHDSFEIRRSLAHPIDRVWRAWSDPVHKGGWFRGRDDDERHTLDFRVGGMESSQSAPTPMGIHTNETIYLDIIEHERIVFAYSMLMDGRRHSSSLVTVMFTSAGGETDMTFTEQAAFFEGSDGIEMRKMGWTHLLDQMGQSLNTLPRTPDQ